MTRWIAEPENQILLVGAVLMLVGAFVLICLAFPTTRTPAPPEPHGWNSFAPATEEMPVIPDVPAAPKYVPVEEFYPLAGYLTAAIDAAADATEELAQVIEVKPVDPLDATVELEAVDPSVPLFYAIKRPGPYVAESFTQGITRAQIARVLEAGRPQ